MTPLLTIDWQNMHYKHRGSYNISFLYLMFMMDKINSLVSMQLTGFTW